MPNKHTVSSNWNTRVSEVTGPINRLGFPKKSFLKKIQAILSKVTGPNNDIGKR